MTLHKNVLELVRNYQQDLEEFGPLGFEIHVVKRPQGGGTPTEYAMLNEHQATLLMILRTLNRGSPGNEKMSASGN